ncbi:hypothetical protein NC652_002124 [Populus alba x Populus x berolinensis]|nr:hypothetical protein NC652_002124 [Populus alba x Populus x berolinensis]
MTMLNSPASSFPINPPSSDMNSDHQKMCRGKTKVSSSPHRSKQTVSSPLPAQGHSSMPCPNERIPTTPGIITPQAGCSQIPLIGSTPGTSHSPSLVHFPGFTSSAACHIQGADDCGEFPVQLLLFVSDLVIESLRLASCGCYSIFVAGVGLITTL